MGRYVEGWNRSQSFLLPESVDEYVGEDNPVRVLDHQVPGIPDQGAVHAGQDASGHSLGA